MWVLLQPGDAALVPTPATRSTSGARSSPAPTVPQVPIGAGRGLHRERDGRLGAGLAQAAGHRAVVPAQPDHGHASTSPSCSGWSTAPASTRSSWCTTSPTPTSRSTATCRRRSCRCRGRQGRRGRALHDDQVVLDGRLAGRLRGRQPEIVAALTKLKTYLDYGTFQPIQIAATVAMNEAPDYPREVNEIYQSRRDALCDGLDRIGWAIDAPKGTMFVWAPIPEPYAEMGSHRVRQEAGATRRRRASSPGVGFGAGRRRLRAVRPHRERAADRPGRPRNQEAA